MVRRLPPLTALRAFEAAARHLNFVRAGAELGVTPGAISHQVKQLEEWVGGALFERRAHGVTLTSRGVSFSKQLGAIFDQITVAAFSARSRELDSEVLIRCQYSLAMRWLAPRMAKFHEVHPDIAIRISAMSQKWNAQDPTPDLAIYHSLAEKKDMQQDLLLAGHLTAVCAPAFVERLPPQPTPADLVKQPLIKVDFSEPGWNVDSWENWFYAAGFTNITLKFSTSVNLLVLAIEACLAGAGFALIPNFLIEKELAEGLLVDPFQIHFPVRIPYVLMTPVASFDRPDVAIVRNWLLSHR
jgi:LysR family glycine cleavage system transcriptional activator